MKLRNKKTGEIRNCQLMADGFIVINSLKDLEEWEDYEEPKKYWTVECGVAVEYTSGDERFDRPIEAVGLKFDTKEECDRAIEKLKAWKRLKDKGFRFSKDWVYRYDQPKVENHTYFEMVAICEDGVRFDDLDLLFGGEE